MDKLERGKTNNNNNNDDVVIVRPRNTAAAPTTMRAAAFKKVEIVYYLSRNGHLEHPHYMEVTHLSHQQLRLKDVMDRLAVLRGKGMPSLYSWSCKRSYKNGYVWNDLAVNDVIHPSQGAEFVLKGSELIQLDKLHHDLQLGNVVQHKRKSLPSKRQQHEPEEMSNNNHNNNNNQCDNYPIEVEEEEEEEEFKEQVEPHKNGASDLLLSSFSSPPSTTSSTVSDKANNDIIITNINTNINNNISASKRYEDGDQVGNEPALSINSMLLSLIACGGSASFRKTVPPPVVIKPPPPPRSVDRKSGGGGRVAEKVVVEDDEIMIDRISENTRRFRKLQAEEKEYFSGSIVESMSMERIHEVQPGLLKKSSSHNEERSNVIGLREAADEEVEREKGLKGKCIPRKKSSAKH
ncbi:hypothetical protein ABFX02_08G223100 [Erythranthe guttata]